MKRVIISALIVLGLAACESEPSRLDVDINEGIVHNVEVSLDGTTRATSDKGFDLENIASTDYELRYILEIYLNGATHSQTILYTNETSVSIPVRLAPEREYRIVVWADLVERVVNDERDMTQDYDRYYETSNGLRAIEVLGNWVAMDESRDAYTDYVDVVGYSSTTDIKLELTRPFSKIRIVTTDVADATATPKSVEVSYLRIPTMYDAYTATASNLVPKSATIDIDLSSPVYTDETNELTLYTDYIFADNEHSDVDLSIDIKDENNATIKSHDLSDIKTKRNMLTTLKGKFLTNGN